MCEENKLKIMVCIPAYNEANHIAKVVSRSKEFADKVVVVNDGSTDDTAQVAKAAMALVINKDYRRGYGESIKSCLEIAKQNNADILITIDGDGQHNPDEIPILIAPIITGEASLVIGSRFLSKRNYIPRYRKLGIRFITFLFNFASKVKVTDAQSGFRAYNRNILEDLNPIEKGMAISIEILINIRHKGYLIKEVPISCVYHATSHKSNPIVHGLGVALKLIRIRFKSV